MGPVPVPGGSRLGFPAWQSNPGLGWSWSLERSRKSSDHPDFVVGGSGSGSGNRESVPFVESPSRVVGLLHTEFDGARFLARSPRGHEVTTLINASPTPAPRAVGETHIEINSIVAAGSLLMALTCPTGVPSRSAMTFRGTSRRRAAQRSAVASIQSASPDRNAAGDSAKASSRTDRHSGQSSGFSVFVVTFTLRLSHLWCGIRWPILAAGAPRLMRTCQRGVGRRGIDIESIEDQETL